jgi:hypothetical protein
MTRITISPLQVREGYPPSDQILIRRNQVKLTSDFFVPNQSKFFLVNFIKNAILVVSFQWTSWGNVSKDLKEQTMQEVTNFGILSALSLALNISLVVCVDGNSNWTGSVWIEAIGLIFNISSTALVISLLSSAFFLLLFNETPSGVASERLVQYFGVWLRMPGLSFVVGIYGFSAIMMTWILHNFNIWISLGSCAVAVIVASVTLFGSVTCGMSGVFEIMSNFGIMTITTNEAILTLLNIYVEQWKKLNNSEHNHVTGYRREYFLNWVLKEYDCCEYCDITIKRLNNVLEKWENEMAGVDIEK